MIHFYFTDMTDLKIGACASLNVLRGQPFPYLNEGETTCLINIKHSLQKKIKNGMT